MSLSMIYITISGACLNVVQITIALKFYIIVRQYIYYNIALREEKRDKCSTVGISSISRRISRQAFLIYILRKWFLILLFELLSIRL